MKDIQKLLQAGRLSEAERACRDFQARRPDEPAGFAGLGWVAMREQRWEAAIACWDDCLSRFPRRAELSWMVAKGRALLALGNFAAAEAAFRGAAARWPDEPEPIRRLIALNARRHDQRRNLELFDRLMAATPGDPTTRLGRALCRATCGGDLAECRDVLADLLATPPQRGVWNGQLHEEVLFATQYCCGGGERGRFLDLLAARARPHAARDADAATFLARVCMALGDYEEADRIVRGLPARGVAGAVPEGMARACAARLSVAYPDHLDAKVFGIGLSKTATTSLDQALNMLGISAIHWRNPYTAALISDADLFLFQGFSDIVISCQFERLCEMFPNARFVYTTRRIDSWCASVADHYRRLHAVETPADLRRPDLLRRFDGVAGNAEMALFGHHASWEDAYRRFDRRVRRFFADQPAEKFLELSICAGEGWEKLCPFLGKPVPATPFPVANAAPPGCRG